MMKNPLLRSSCLLALSAGLAWSAPGEHDHGGDASRGGQDQARPDFKLSSEEKPWEDRVQDFYGGMSPEQLSQFKNYISHCKDQQAALRSAVQMQESITELKSLFDKVRSGELSQYEFAKQQEGYFNKINHTMLKEMDHEQHSAYMANFKSDLDSVGYNVNDRHIKDWQAQNPGKDSFQYGADFQLRNGKPAEAAQDASRVLELDPKDPRALTTRAGALYQMKDYAGAAEDARRALEANPKNPQALSLLKLSEGRAGRPEGDVRRDSTGDPLPLDRSDPSRSNAPLIRTSGADLTLSAQLARSAANALRLGDHAAALRDADKAISANPDNLQAYHLRAMSYLWLGRPQDAYADTVAALRKAPGNLALLVTQANALNRMRNFAQAKASAEAALRSDSNSADAWYNLAYAEAGLGNHPGSLDALRRAAQLSPAQYDARYKAAIQLPESGDLLMLFSAEGRPAQEARPEPPARRSRLPLFLLLGAALTALGLKGGDLFSFLKTFWLRLTGRRAAVSVVPMDSFSDSDRPSFASGFRILRQIGSGGMGAVYEAQDLGLDRRVAIKRMREEIRLDAQERDRFLKEARTVAALRHPNIVEIFGVVEDGQEAYLVFEFVEGATLDQVLAERDSLPPDQARGLLRQIASALDYAHGRGVIHRDLKPSNIMVTEDGTVKVMDFGVARRAKDAAMALTDTVAGTPPYMAPEAENGTVRKESDIFSLGVLLYELLTGRIPFQGSGAGMLLNKMNMAFEPPSRSVPSLPPGVDAFFARMFQADPERRPRTAAEAADAFDASL